MTAAVGFIRACLAARWAAAGLARAEAAGAAGFDWEAVLAASYRTRTTALLYDALYEEAWVPDAVRDRLRQVYLQAAVRHLRLTHRYAQLLAALTDAGIDHLVFKGPVLAELVYGNPAVRAYTDLDVLVHRADLEAVQGILNDLGYRRRQDDVRPGVYESFGNEAPWSKRDDGYDLHIDLHWKPVSKLYDAMPWVWESADPWEIYGVPTRVFSPEVRLLYLSAHLTVHHGQREAHETLLWRYDVALAAQGHPRALAWSSVLTLARTHGLMLPLKRAIAAIDATWTVPLPDAVRQALETFQPTGRAVRTLDLLNAPVDRQVDHTMKFWVILAKQPSWRQRIGYVLSHVFPTWGYMRAHYGTRGPVATALRYPYRWGYGAVSLLRMVGRMGRG
jgi:hypothetical protein